MTFTTKEFFAKITKDGLSRPNRFSVIIHLPKILKNPDDSKTLSMMCMQTEMPSKTINTSETKYNGNIKKLAMSKLYYQQQFVFAVDSRMKEKDIIDDWMNGIIPDTHELEYYDNYTSEIEIYQLDQQDKPIHGVKIKGCFPVICNPLTLSNSDTNTVHQLMVQFAYETWDIILKNGQTTTERTTHRKQFNAETTSFNPNIEAITLNENDVDIDTLTELKQHLTEKGQEYTDKYIDILTNATKDNLHKVLSDVEILKSNSLLKKITDKEKVDKAVDKISNKLKTKVSSNAKKMLGRLF